MGSFRTGLVTMGSTAQRPSPQTHRSRAPDVTRTAIDRACEFGRKRVRDPPPRWARRRSPRKARYSPTTSTRHATALQFVALRVRDPPPRVGRRPSASTGRYGPTTCHRQCIRHIAYIDDLLRGPASLVSPDQLSAQPTDPPGSHTATRPAEPRRVPSLDSAAGEHPTLQARRHRCGDHSWGRYSPMFRGPDTPPTFVTVTGRSFADVGWNRSPISGLGRERTRGRSTGAEFGAQASVAPR